jgi:hypothetical protein
MCLFPKTFKTGSTNILSCCQRWHPIFTSVLIRRRRRRRRRRS